MSSQGQGRKEGRWRPGLARDSEQSQSGHSGFIGTTSVGSPPPHCHLASGEVDWLVPSEVDIQDLCAEEAESKELEELWTSTYIFITLFLLSVSYGATVTLLKVGSCTSVGGAREG